jgi:hypothetical protein
MIAMRRLGDREGEFITGRSCGLEAHNGIVAYRVGQDRAAGNRVWDRLPRFRGTDACYSRVDRVVLRGMVHPTIVLATLGKTAYFVVAHGSYPCFTWQRTQI